MERGGSIRRIGIYQDIGRIKRDETTRVKTVQNQKYRISNGVTIHAKRKRAFEGHIPTNYKQDKR